MQKKEQEQYFINMPREKISHFRNMNFDIPKENSHSY